MKNPLFLTLCFPLLAFGAPNRSGPPAAGPGVAPGAGLNCPARVDCPLALATPAAPTTLKAADLVFAIEEERVAHDLYVAAAARWNLPVFATIAGAETRHAAALTPLAATIGVIPPAAQAGVYATADLQRLYEQLLPLVNESASGALRAGALVEETDIADLRRMAGTATDEGSRIVLAQLERASGHHLAAFVRNLAALGVAYQPQVLAADDFAALIAAAPGRGAGGNGSGGGGYRGGR